VRADTRDRLLLPILLPIGILAAVGLVLWAFSRILLEVHGTAATAVALVVAATIVVVAAVAASRPQVRGSTIAAMLGGVAGVAMLAGGIAIVSLAGEEEGGGPGPGGPGGAVHLVAANIAFDPTALTAPAGAPFTIAFDNQDTVQHNVQIFDNPDFGGTPLFDGDLVTGPAQVAYEVPALDAGTYFFRCVVHPPMTGQIDAVEGGGGGGGGGGGPVAVAAQNLAFDTDTINLPADAPSTIAFDNRDPGVPHNISIYSDANLGAVLFQGELVTGPATAEYAIPPEPAGEYYFQCDVHPTMNGTVIVAAGAPPPGEPGAGGGGPTGPSP
jgi:plastocyanin